MLGILAKLFPCSEFSPYVYMRVDHTRIQNESKPPQQEAHGASLTDKEITEYQRLFKAEFGIDLTKDQALEKGLRLVRLLRVVLKGDEKEINT